MRKSIIWLLPGGLLLSFAVCRAAGPAQERGPQDLLDSTLWAATAVEHDGAALQAYHLARLMLDRALRDRSWTAAIEQRSAQKNVSYRSLPPAIITDLDETMLDNWPFEARMLFQGIDYDPKDWDQWVAEARAGAIPGAVEFAHYAQSRGVTVFYVTNRDASLKQATRANLAQLGFPLDDRKDTLYCAGDRPEWGTDKTPRRADIAAHYRILLLLGDDLGDFVSGANSSLDQRREIAKSYQRYWGERWIVLPNAMYGSWLSSLFYGTQNVTEQEKQRLKYETLRKLVH